MLESIRTLGEKIHGIRVAMMTTMDPDGVLRSRPMETPQTDFDGRLWFFTDSQSGKVASIKNDQHVNLAYAAPDDNRYVSVAGSARLVRDREKMRELWKPMFQTWFPRGLEDPELSLICVDVESAEYWDEPSSAFVSLAGVTGKG